MASSRPQQGSKLPRQEEELVDPSYDWQENADNFVLRIHLTATGFRKQDFKVQVDGAGRLTVRGQRTDAAADGRHSRRLNKVFQLPSTANLEDISGRFEAGVLTLTVPKKKGQPNKNKQAEDPISKADEAEHKEAMAATKKPTCAPPVAEAATTKKPGASEQAEAKRGEPPAVQEEQDQRKATAAPPAAGSAAPTTVPDKKNKDQAAAPPTDKKPADPAEKAKRRAEEEADSQRAAKPAAASTAADEEEAPPRRGYGFRELQGLATSEWAEGLLDTVKKNREVIAVAVAAFSLGLFVSSRLLCSSTSRN